MSWRVMLLGSAWFFPAAHANEPKDRTMPKRNQFVFIMPYRKARRGPFGSLVTKGKSVTGVGLALFNCLAPTQRYFHRPVAPVVFPPDPPELHGNKNEIAADAFGQVLRKDWQQGGWRLA